MIHYLKAPLGTDSVAALRAGDLVKISGVIYTGRDSAHKRMVEAIKAHHPLPFDPAGQIIYYVGPTPAPPGRPIGSAGPTTSYRMDPYTPDLLAQGLKAMIGKGARSKQVKAAMMKYGAVYLAAVGGAGALLGKRIKKAEVIAYEDLGPEAIRRLVVQDFPAIVINDIYGQDLYQINRAAFERSEP